MAKASYTTLDGQKMEIEVPEGMIAVFSHNANGSISIRFEDDKFTHFFRNATAEQWRERMKEIQTLLSDQPTYIKGIKALRETMPWLGLKAAKHVAQVIVFNEINKPYELKY